MGSTCPHRMGFILGGGIRGKAPPPPNGPDSLICGVRTAAGHSSHPGGKQAHSPTGGYGGCSVPIGATGDFRWKRKKS
ncbi:UNVERIFIED_CONTAM: hypothetical protein K2H54_042392 [Gekko kuhli]